MSKREGPKVEIRLSCFGCQYEHSESYAVQGDRGHDVSCTHPHTADRRIGDTTWNTPDWCPFIYGSVDDAIRAWKEKHDS